MLWLFPFMNWIRTEYHVNCEDRIVIFSDSLIGPMDPKKLEQKLRTKHLTAPTIMELFCLARKALIHLKDHSEDSNANLIKTAFSNWNGVLSFTRVLATKEGIYAYDPAKFRRERPKEKVLRQSLKKKIGDIHYNEDETIRYLSRKNFFTGSNIKGDNRFGLILGKNLNQRTGFPRPLGEEDSLVRRIYINLPSPEYNYEQLPCYTFVSLKISPSLLEIDGRNFCGGRGYSGDYTIGVIRRE